MSKCSIYTRDIINVSVEGFISLDFILIQKYNAKNKFQLNYILTEIYGKLNKVWILIVIDKNLPHLQQSKMRTAQAIMFISSFRQYQRR